MKTHPMAMSASLDTRAEGTGAMIAEANAQTARNKRTRRRRASGKPSFVSARAGARRHTLVLTGVLDRASAHALEAEMDRLCEEEITGLRLDLRRLAHIDSIGVAVIAFRCGLYQRRGYEVTLIPGPQLVHSAFERAGLAERLPFEEDGAAPDAPPRRANTVLTAVGSGEGEVPVNLAS
jgi:anti-anti-sigma factor